MATGLARGSGQSAAFERAPRNKTDAVSPATGDDFQLDGPGGQTVLALLADEPEEIATGGDLVCSGDVPCGEVAAAHIEDFAFPDELLHRLPDFVPGRCPLDVVHLVEVDKVSLQPAQ